MDTAAALVVLGVVIGANNLAVALALGSLGQAGRGRRIVAVFGVFEFLMPLAGMAVGQRLSSVVAARADWISPLLLVALGAWAAHGSLSRGIDVEDLAERAATWGGLVLLAATLSIDNLVAGFALGLREVPPLALAAVISVSSMLFAAIGLRVGAAAHRNAPRLAGAASGLLLVALGVLLAADVL